MKNILQSSSRYQEVRSICSLSEAKTNSTTKPTLLPRSVSAMAIMLNCACLIFNSPQASAQIITTVAGNGTLGYTGDGGQATTAELNDPSAVAFDVLGNMYISDESNGVIRKINTAGIISTFAGNGIYGNTGNGGQATDAGLYSPSGIAFDAVGNLYIADNWENCVRKVNTAGVINQYAGNGTQTYGGDGGQALSAGLSSPADVACDALGNLYISDTNNMRVRKVNSAGIISTIVGNGTNGYGGDGGQATDANLSYPGGICLDATGNLYIADTYNNRVRMVNTAGIISTVAGNGIAGYSGDGGAATAAELKKPDGIISDFAGNLYIADFSNNRIRSINTAGIINTIVGNGVGGYSGDGGAATAAELVSPIGMAFDTSGNLYIADLGNLRIRKVTNVEQIGIEQVTMKNTEVRIYPNPSNSVINVELGVMSESPSLTLPQGERTITVTDVLGNAVIHNSSLKTHNLALDVSGLPAGVYFIRVGTATQKFIKQ